MKTSTWIALTACVVGVLCFGASVLGQNVTVDGLALLKIEVGARPAGMGGAFSSVFGDPRSSVYNPAGAISDDDFQLSVGHAEYWENIRLETGLFTKRLSSRVYLHGGIRYGAVDELEARQIASVEPTSYFDAQDVSLKTGVAYEFSPRFRAGIAAGWVLQKIEAFRGSAFNVDVGIQGEPWPNVHLGVSALQIGSDMKLTADGRQGSDDVPLPTIYRLGGHYRYDRYLGAVDLVFIDSDPHVHLGAEAQLHEMFSLRSGFMTGYDTKNFTAGASFTQRTVTIDYAFVPYTESLGTTHIFNLTLTL